MPLNTSPPQKVCVKQQAPSEEPFLLPCELDLADYFVTFGAVWLALHTGLVGMCCLRIKPIIEFTNLTRGRIILKGG